MTKSQMQRRVPPWQYEQGLPETQRMIASPRDETLDITGERSACTGGIRLLIPWKAQYRRRIRLKDHTKRSVKHNVAQLFGLLVRSKGPFVA